MIDINTTPASIPKVLVSNDILTITITADELKWITEHRPDCNYIVHYKSEFLKDFAAELEHFSSTSESGLSLLQELIDDIVDQTYESSLSITNNDDE